MAGFHHTVRRIRNRIYVLKSQFDKNVDYQKFVIVARSRTGSNLLLSLLNAHPNIKVYGEVFQRLDGRSYEDVLATYHGVHARNVRAAGFKIFYYHPLDHPNCGIWDELARREEIAVIHLRRRNLLRVALSRALMMRTGAHTSMVREVGSGEKRIHLDPVELEECFETTKKYEKETEERFRGHRVLNMLYEDLSSHQGREFGRVVDFLGVPVHMDMPLRRQNPERASELIQNFDELCEYFRGSPWENYFNNKNSAA